MSAALGAWLTALVPELGTGIVLLLAFAFRWLLPILGTAIMAMALLGAPGRGTPPLASF